MNNQEILNTLSLLEAVLFYRIDGKDDRENVKVSDLEKTHDLITAALLNWHNVTGCTLTD